MTMTIRPRTPSLFRPRKPIDQGVLTENRKLVDDVNRRGLLRGAVSLGALTLLTGCDVSEIDSVQKALRAVSSWNDGVQNAKRSKSQTTSVRPIGASAASTGTQESS